MFGELEQRFGAAALFAAKSALRKHNLNRYSSQY